MQLRWLEEENIVPVIISLLQIQMRLLPKGTTASDIFIIAYYKLLLFNQKSMSQNLLIN